mmetsp:Transcript_110425/g.319151  ORF Transcript_110425/g.319151 Transcript_110425/m.319151 type:complete len:206 (+) Transcript_110425:434-1051(+)
MGEQSLTVDIVFRIVSTCWPRACARFCLPSASAFCISAFACSKRPSSCSTSAAFSLAVSLPASAIVCSSAETTLDFSLRSSTPTPSKSACSSDVNCSSFVIFASISSNLVILAFNKSRSLFFCPYVGNCTSTNSLKSSASQVIKISSGVCVSSSSSSPPSSRPPCAVAPEMCGKTCTNFKFLPVSCWYLNFPPEAASQAAVLSSP